MSRSLERVWGRVSPGIVLLAHYAARLTPLRLAPMLLGIALISDLGAGFTLAKVGGQDRLVIGNTAGMLSVLLQVNHTHVVIGGGESRSDLADFVDRSTLPWDRQVGLLVIPGWDERHAAGALGLVDRGNVDGIIVIGSDGRGRAWFTLTDEAREKGIRVRYLAGEHHLDIASRVSLTFEDPGATGRRIRTGQRSHCVITMPRS